MLFVAHHGVPHHRCRPLHLYSSRGRCRAPGKLHRYKHGPLPSSVALRSRPFESSGTGWPWKYTTNHKRLTLLQLATEKGTVILLLRTSAQVWHHDFSHICVLLPWGDMVWKLDSDPGPYWAVYWTVDRGLVELEGRAAHVVDWGGEALWLYQLPRVRPKGREWKLKAVHVKIQNSHWFKLMGLLAW